MDKESIIGLQMIDCNCNDCKHMERDFATYQKWKAFHRGLQHKEFEQRAKEAFARAEECEDEKGRTTLLQLARKMRFQFDKSGLINYGNCMKFSKPVSFIPGICQLDTQECFEHRRAGQRIDLTN